MLSASATNAHIDYSNLQVFLIFSILMYLVATLHISKLSRSAACKSPDTHNGRPALAAIRFYKSLFLGIDPRGAVHYLKSWRHWEYFPLIVLFCVQTWLGDALVVRIRSSYRLVDRRSFDKDLPVLLRVERQFAVDLCPCVLAAGLDR